MVKIFVLQFYMSHILFILYIWMVVLPCTKYNTPCFSF